MNGYAIRRLDPDSDGPAIGALLARNIAGLDGPAAARKCREAYAGNPVGVGEAFGLIDDGIDLVGALALQARRWHRGAETRKGACFADFSVDARHRSLGPALRLVRHAIEATGSPLLYGFPNPQARGLLQRAGLQAVGRMRRYGRLLSVRALRRPGAPRTQRMLAAFPTVLDPLLRWGDAVLCGRRAQGFKAREAGFGEHWLDTAWHGRAADLWVSARDAAGVAWRYRSDLKRDWRIARVDDAQGRPVGHVVWRLASGLVEIGDVHGAGLPQRLSALLLAFAALARREGATALSFECLGHAGVDAALRAAGFLHHADSDPLLATVPQCLAWPRDAFVTGYDRDTH